jgi:hypothetical protein
LHDVVPPFGLSQRERVVPPRSGKQGNPSLLHAQRDNLVTYPGRRIREIIMDALRRVAQEAEKPGRLLLAIVEWQRQLIAREAQSIGRLKEPDYERLARSWSA